MFVEEIIIEYSLRSVLANNGGISVDQSSLVATASLYVLCNSSVIGPRIPV